MPSSPAHRSNLALVITLTLALAALAALTMPVTAFRPHLFPPAPPVSSPSSSSSSSFSIAEAAGLPARGKSPAAFDHRCIPPRGVARRSNTPGIFPPRALRGGRLDALGATLDFHHGLLDPDLVDGAVAVASTMPRLHSLLVDRGGELLVERYFNAASARRTANIKSASKSVLSALVGIALGQGHLTSVDQTIDEFFPEYLLAAEDPRKREITIEDLLTMRAGLESTSFRNYGAWVMSRNWIRHALTQPMRSASGTTRRYSTGNTHLLSAILTKATGLSTWEYAQRHLAEPIGFSLARWPTDPQGIYFGGNDMLFTPRQMLQFGLLYLNRGRVGDRQVVPAQWVDKSVITRTRSRRGGRGYGYSWWVRYQGTQKIFYAWGYGGQFIFVVPDLDLVAVTTSSTDPQGRTSDHNRRIYQIVEDYLVPAAEAGA